VTGRPGLPALFLIVMSLGAGSMAPLAAEPDHRLGVVDFRNLEDAGALGSHWARMPAEWVFIEPEDDLFNWSSGLAGWIDEGAPLGIRPSIVVTIGQMWASGYPDGEGGAPSYPPSDLTVEEDPDVAYSATYYDFIANLVTEYGDRIDRITIENEVNTYGFWVGSMDEYRRLLATARKAIDDHAPHVLLFDSGIGSGAWGAAMAEWMIHSGEFSEEEILDFANDYYEYDVYAPFQFASYVELLYWLWQPFVQENNKHVAFVLAAAPEYLDGLNFKFTESSWLLPGLVAWMDDRMAEHGHALPLKVNNEASNWEREDDVDEGQNLFRMVVEGLAVGVEQSLWFPYSNETVSTPRRGLLDESGTLTPQADAFAHLADVLGDDHAFAGRETIGNVHRFRFMRAGDPAPTLDVMWWDDGEHGSGVQSVTVDVPPFTEEVHRTNYDGASGITIPVEGDSVTTAVSHIPRVYAYQLSILDVDTGAPPTARRMGPASPSPFRARTSFRVELGVGAGSARVRIHDPAGRLVRELPIEATHGAAQTITWDGTTGSGKPVPSGVYATSLVIDGVVVESDRVVVIR